MAVLEIAFAKLFSNSQSKEFKHQELKQISGGYAINAYNFLINYKGINFRPYLGKTNNQNLKKLINLMSKNYNFTTAWFGSFCFKGKSFLYQKYINGIILNHSYSILRVWWDDDYAKKRKFDSDFPQANGLIFLCYNPWGYKVPFKSNRKNLPAGHFILKGTEIISLAESILIYPCVYSTNDKDTF